MKNKIFSSGFTLIEILIVVALLGALAIGLMATLDPFQQIRKGTDSTRRTMANDLYRALVAYQSTQGQFPWGVTDPFGPFAGDDDTNMDAHITSLINAGELKSNFTTAAGTNLGKLYISTTDADGDSVHDLNVCFVPESKSIKSDPSTTYNQDGTELADCSTAVGGSCYLCVK